jgi:serine-type D-Ala-D-Ala endopeptidase (penicillin-binding protein 7)
MMKQLTKAMGQGLALALLAVAMALPATQAVAASGPNKPTKLQKQTSAVKQSAAAQAKANRVEKRAGKRKVAARAAPPRPSIGQLTGLHLTDDPLDLKSAVALVIDQDTNEVLVSKNPQAVLPIASITKLMTAMVVTDAKLPMDEMLEVTAIDPADSGKKSRSRLAVGTQLPRSELMHLSLMASENRAAQALGRSYPGGMAAFVKAMNVKAAELGMSDTRYVEPTGLSSQNRSSAHDLSVLVRAAMAYPQIREMSISQDASVAVGAKQVQFKSTNGLVRSGSWDIGLQKTGYISEAGRCLVMQASLAGRQLIMVLLDSAGKYSRIGDAERIRNWLVQTQLTPAAAIPKS